MRKIIALGLCLAPVFWFCLWLLEERLLKAGVLNKKDMTFVGNETGMMWEYLTNVWHWDAALMILFLFALASSASGIFLLGSKRNTNQAT